MYCWRRIVLYKSVELSWDGHVPAANQIKVIQSIRGYLRNIPMSVIVLANFFPCMRLSNLNQRLSLVALVCRSRLCSNDIIFVRPHHWFLPMLRPNKHPWSYTYSLDWTIHLSVLLDSLSGCGCVCMCVCVLQWSGSESNSQLITPLLCQQSFSVHWPFNE